MLYRISMGLDARACLIAATVLDHLTGEVAQRSFTYDSELVASWTFSLELPTRRVYESGPTGVDLQGSPASFAWTLVTIAWAVADCAAVSLRDGVWGPTELYAQPTRGRALSYTRTTSVGSARMR